MGQQQLLLLVLSTVIVGLATVAGIQAFSENQAQASQDALVNKAVSVATDVKSITSKPEALGGTTVTDINTGSGPSLSQLADMLGLSGTTFDVPGAGSDADCQIVKNSSEIQVQCESSSANQDIQVRFDPDGDPDQVITETKSDDTYSISN